MIRLITILALIIILSGCSTVSLTGENDIFGISENRDMMYTNGVRLTYTKHKDDAPEILKSITDPLPTLLLGKNLKTNRYTFEVGQEMHTPDNISKFELQENSNPFVGFLYAKNGKEEITTEYRKFAFFTLGTTGPNSFADKTQKWFHGQFDMAKPNGWVNQIDNEIVFMHESGVDIRDVRINYGSTKFEQSSGYNLKLGTWQTSLEFNITHRLGQNYELFSAAQQKDWSWHLYNKPFIKLIARDMTMDGNTFESSHSVDSEPFVYGDEFGTILEYSGYGLKLYVRAQSKQFSEQDKDYHTYGGFNFVKLFDLY